MLPHSTFSASSQSHPLQLLFASFGTNDRRPRTSQLRILSIKTQSTQPRCRIQPQTWVHSCLEPFAFEQHTRSLLLTLLCSRQALHIASHWHGCRTTTHDAIMNLRPQELTFGASIWLYLFFCSISSASICILMRPPRSQHLDPEGFYKTFARARSAFLLRSNFA
jgi:hypothetical protein